MPTLEFKGKPFVYSHHLSVPFRELMVDPKKSLPAKGDKPSLDDNLIIHGDNLEALKALLPRYAGKVDVIYIDPPYNTGKEGWAYNDKVNSPLMKEWLGKVVDRDDLERHDKWLCMMWPRLQLLKELLSEKGVLFASIDDNEVASLKQGLIETFGPNNWLGTIIWKNATDNNPTNVAIEHEYIHAFANTRDGIPAEWKSPVSDLKNKLLQIEQDLLKTGDKIDAVQKKYTEWFRLHKAQLAPLQEYDQIDKGGIFTASRSVHNPGREGYRWDLRNPKTGKLVPQPLMGYRFPEETRDQLLKDDRIIFSEDSKQLIRIKIYVREYNEKMPSVIEIDGRRGANELRKLFPDIGNPFKNPKTYTLLEWLFSFTAKQDAVILDSFAGSGTTAHAVAALNATDNGNRKFVLIQLPESLAAESPARKTGFKEIIDITLERVRRVINGVPKSEDKALKKGLGGSFTFCELGDALDLGRFFDGKGAPTYEQVARYVVYTATGQSVADVPKEPRKDWFVAEAGGYRIHLIYKPDLAFMRSNDAALALPLAKEIVKGAKGKPVLVYAAAKFMAQAELTKGGITFCQLPYSVHRVLGEAPDAS
jgi:adenine-specific DNA-methyltransferase